MGDNLIPSFQMTGLDRSRNNLQREVTGAEPRLGYSLRNSAVVAAKLFEQLLTCHGCGNGPGKKAETGIGGGFRCSQQ
jgi:hypothetical protein